MSKEALDIVEAVADVAIADWDVLPRADVLWVRLGKYIGEDVLRRARALRIVATATTGVDHIDAAATAARGIAVFSLRGETTFLDDIRATAEHTIGSTLALLRRYVTAAADVKSGRWQRDLYRGEEIAGKVVGLVGFGRLGRMVAPLFEAFGAQVVWTDPARTGSLSLKALLSVSDIVSLHVNLNETNIGFFGSSAFGSMKSGSWFVNTSRAQLIDETALLSVLESGHLSGAALDVISGEPHPDPSNPLFAYARKHDNLLITPHLGGCTMESMHKTEVFLATKICAALSAG